MSQGILNRGYRHGPKVGQAQAREARASGMKVVIVAAGGAVHLGSMISSLTPLPAIVTPPLRGRV